MRKLLVTSVLLLPMMSFASNTCVYPIFYGKTLDHQKVFSLCIDDVDVMQYTYVDIPTGKVIDHVSLPKTAATFLIADEGNYRAFILNDTSSNITYMPTQTTDLEDSHIVAATVDILLDGEQANSILLDPKTVSSYIIEDLEDLGISQVGKDYEK